MRSCSLRMRRSCACFQCSEGLGHCGANKPLFPLPVAMPNECSSAPLTLGPGTASCYAVRICGRSTFRPFSASCVSLIRGHIAPKSQALAAALNIVLVWLPKQCSELNAMDHLWRALKANISANYQFKNIDEHADFAEHWVLSLSRSEALLKAGVFSKNFWLQAFVK
jgi:hypothetical protein